MFPRALDRFSRVLGSTPHVSLVEISDAGHFTLNQKPSEIAALVLDAVASTACH
jgi:pimeloyl-ACP methyl ester carboxylesterase